MFYLGSRQIVLNQFLLIDVFLIVIRIDFPIFFLLPCKLWHVSLRNEFDIDTYYYLLLLLIFCIVFRWLGMPNT